VYPDKELGTVAFGRHLWYVSELLIGFRFFDDEVSVEDKRLMVSALDEDGGMEKPTYHATSSTSN